MLIYHQTVIDSKCLLGNLLPVNPSDTLLYNASDLLENVRVFLVHPMCQVSSIIKDLQVQGKCM